jgi:hypothetical protein
MATAMPADPAAKPAETAGRSAPLPLGSVQREQIRSFLNWTDPGKEQSSLAGGDLFACRRRLPLPLTVCSCPTARAQTFPQHPSVGGLESLARNQRAAR